MKLTDQLTAYVHATFTGIWIHSHEVDEAQRDILQHARQQGWKVAVWDMANGLRLPSEPGTTSPDSGVGDPLAALRALPMTHPGRERRSALAAGWRRCWIPP